MCVEILLTHDFCAAGCTHRATFTQVPVAGKHEESILVSEVGLCEEDSSLSAEIDGRLVRANFGLHVQGDQQVSSKLCE